MSIQLFKPKFEIEECIAEIRECLEKGWTGLGYKTEEFEKLWKEYTGLSNAYYTNSATIALNMAVALLKMEYKWNDGDEIITTPITFVSTNHAILKAGMKAIFADIDETLCISPQSVKNRITDKTKAIMFVGMGGNIGNYYQIVDICQEYGLKLILDGAHMAGTRYKGIVPGKEADAVIYSFQAVKNLPTADSGMLCFKETHLDKIARKYGWLGINKDTYQRTSLNTGNYKWKYDVEYLGEKAHGNSIIASIAIAQLKYLDRDNAYRRQIAKWYHEFLDEYTDKIKFVKIPEDCESSTHLFQILVEKRNELLMYLNDCEIYPGVHYIDNTEYCMYEYEKNQCDYAAYVSEHILSLPVHMDITYDDVKFISNKIIDWVTK